MLRQTWKLDVGSKCTETIRPCVSKMHLIFLSQETSLDMKLGLAFENLKVKEFNQIPKK